MDSTKRIRWIDVAKGLCMFFIVLGHVCKANYRTDPLRIFCYSFNAQAFFFLSGYTFMGVTTLTKGKFLNINVRAYILKWIDRVLYPYFVWGTISIFIFFLMGKFGIIDEDTRLLPNFIGLLFGNSTSSYFQWNRPLWFLPCIFLSYLMLLFVVAFYYKNHDSKKIIAFFFALFTFIITVATLMTRINITYINIWHWETAFVLFPLMGGGFLFKQYQPFALCRMGGICVR